MQNSNNGSAGDVFLSFFFLSLYQTSERVAPRAAGIIILWFISRWATAMAGARQPGERDN